MNLAEVGQSAMRGYRKMWLREAAFADIAALALQSAEYKKFLANKEKIMGKGPTLKSRNARQKATEKRFIQQIDDVLMRGNLEAEAEKQVGQIFMPVVEILVSLKPTYCSCAPRFQFAQDESG